MRVALLHALPLDERMWEPQLPALTGHEVHAPRLYELGESIDEWALAVLREAPGRLVAVGASMGGYCVSAMARLAPERLAGIILVGSRAGADPPELAPMRDQLVRVAREGGAAALWSEIRPRLFPETADPETVGRMRKLALEQEPEALARALEAIRDRSDSTEAVTAGVPLLVVAGECDPMIPPELAEELAAASPTGRAEVLERCGHLPSVERPDEFNRILVRFLEAL